MARLLYRLQPLLCPLDFKYPSGSRYYVPTSTQEMEKYYIGTASAYETTKRLTTNDSRVITTELRVTNTSTWGSREVVSHFHRIIVQQGDIVTIVDPRSIFVNRYDEKVFKQISPIFNGSYTELEEWSNYKDLCPKDYWAKDHIEEYLDLIVTSIKKIYQGEKGDYFTLYK